MSVSEVVVVVDSFKVYEATRSSEFVVGHTYLNYEAEGDYRLAVSMAGVTSGGVRAVTRLSKKRIDELKEKQLSHPEIAHIWDSEIADLTTFVESIEQAMG